MKQRIKLIAVVCAMLTVVALGIATIPEARAQPKFIIASSVPYNGNGIAYIGCYLDGVFNATVYYNFDAYLAYANNTPGINPLDVLAGSNITLSVFSWLNGTWAGIASFAEGQNVIRHNVTVALGNGTVVFSKQNFTYFDTGVYEEWAPMYFYRYDVILDFVPEMGQVYIATVTYEVYGVWE